MKKTIALLLALSASILSGVNLTASADDGGISFGGSPKLLKGHSSVSMKDEVVKMEVGDEQIKVQCDFTFHNDGPAAKVRVGFPDEGQGSMEPYQGEDKIPTGKNLKATFLSYESWVDGKKVATELVPTDNRELYWHAKTVQFKGNGDTKIRDVYTLPPGGQMTNENGLYKQTYYVLHTGSSWKGPIGKGEVIISFKDEALKGPIQAKQLKSIGKDPAELVWSKLPSGTVLWEGPGAPKVEGKTLRFTFTNLKPTAKDDVHLYYNWKKCTNM